MTGVTAPGDREITVPADVGPRLPPSILDAAARAGFPESVGDVSTFITLAGLDARTPTVSHLILASGVGPYDSLGLAIQRAILAMNRTTNPRWGMRTIGSAFFSVDAQRLAALSPDARAQALQALQRFTAALGGNPRGPIESQSDTVERQPRRGEPPVREGGPPQQATRLPPPRTAAPAPMGPPLPEHPTLEGTSEPWRTWLQRGDHRMETVEAMLGHRPTSFEAGLAEVQQRYGIGTPGRPNLQQAAVNLQAELDMPGNPDGKLGRITREYLRAARQRYGARIATQPGATEVRRELAQRPNLLASLGLPPEAAQPEPEPAPAPRVDRGPVPAPVEAPPPDPYAQLATIRETNRPAYEAARPRLVSDTEGNPARMLELFRGAYRANREMGTDIANALLDAYRPGVISSLISSHEANMATRNFARLVAGDEALARELPPALSDRLARSIAPAIPGQALVGLSNEELAAMAIYEGSRTTRATTIDDLLDDERNRYATFNWAAPAAVAGAVDRLGLGAPAGSDTFGSALAKYLQGGAAADLDRRVARARAIFQALGASRTAVESAMRGYGHVWGVNFGGIGDQLIERVVS